MYIMDKIKKLVDKAQFFIFGLLFSIVAPVYAQAPTLNPTQAAVRVDPKALKFEIPSFGVMLTFLVRFFFVLAGLAALIMLLWGALGWVTSGGEKEGVEKARDKMVAAIVGVVLIIVALAIIWTLEQLVFAGSVCFGLSCSVSVPQLLTPIP